MTDERTDGPQDPAADGAATPLDGPVLGAADDAFVSDLLARAASAHDMPLPAAVAARWDTAIAAESQARAEAASPVAAAAAAAGTVIPTQRDGRTRRGGGLRLAGVAASVAALALVGGVVANQFASSTTTEDAVVTEADGLPTSDSVSTSGTTYTDDTMDEQADALVQQVSTGSAPAAAPVTTSSTAGSASAPVSPAATAPAGEAVALEPEVQAFVADPERRQQCIENLAQQVDVQPVAVDIGYYKGEPAAMVVLPVAGDPSKVDVYVVGPTCSLAEADLQYFTRVTLDG